MKQEQRSNGQYNPRQILSPLFEQAKEVDEFEFCCCLLRIRGLEAAGWDPLVESNELIQQIARLVNAPIEGKLRIRLLLLLYGHVTEMNDLYSITANLLRVCSGRRYTHSPFLGDWHDQMQEARYPQSKIDRIETWSEEVGFPKVGELFRLMYVKPVRNAFFHSDYVIHGDKFNIKEGEGMHRDNVISKSVDLEWLHDKIELAVNTALAVINLVMDHIGSYKEEKIVSSRLSGEDQLPMDVILTVKEGYGLVGFRSVDQEE